MSGEAFVSIESLCVDYGRFRAVDSLSFEIPKGSIFGFIGPNGAGKTSTMKVMATLRRPSSGRVGIGGVDVVANPQAARFLFGYMPDEFGVYDDLSVEEYLLFFAAAYQLPWDKRPKTVSDVLELTDLSGKREASVNDLSRGMKQRLGLARLLVHDPALLILDEPASGLDPRARIEMRELLKALREMGKTIVISSHILSELGELCDRIAILERGRLVAEGSLSEIYARLDLRREIHARIENLSDSLFAAIKALPGVLSVSSEPDRLSIEIDENLLPLAELNARLVGLGARVQSFQPEAMDMESAFLRLTEGAVQ